MAQWMAACPVCRAPIGNLTDKLLPCPTCAFEIAEVDGIWRCVRPDRLSAINAFLGDYTKVRLAEGRGSADPAYYRRLPEPTPIDPLAWQWSMRATTWDHVCRRILPSLPSGLRVLDLGAGVGWLSNRLHELGHDSVAIELSVDLFDGLGAARYYAGSWPRVQAEFDHLPLADDQADLVVYNASFHYSVNYAATLSEARRVLKPGGHVLVIDSPVYRRDASGRQMVAERHAQFEKRFGTRSDSMPSIEYLTDSLLDELAAAVGIDWQHSTAWYGLRWWWRPWRARLTGAREPSRFITLLGSVG